MHHKTDDIIFSTGETPLTDSQTTRFIDVHIYDIPAEENEPPSVESEVEPVSAVHDDIPNQPSLCRHVTFFVLLSSVVKE